jgi:hypothetical protein
MIPVALSMCLLAKWNTLDQLWHKIWIVMIIELLKNIIIFIIMSTNLWVVAFIMFYCNSYISHLRNYTE